VFYYDHGDDDDEIKQFMNWLNINLVGLRGGLLPAAAAAAREGFPSHALTRTFITIEIIQFLRKSRFVETK
jgi:hypothetical protein